jgi:hypothetical protein
MSNGLPARNTRVARAPDVSTVLTGDFMRVQTANPTSEVDITVGNLGTTIKALTLPAVLEVAVTAEAIHAALVTLGLITAPEE